MGKTTSRTGKGVSQPRSTDVIKGRGKKVHFHPGNIAFRKIVLQHKSEYQNAGLKRKREIRNLVCNQEWNMNGRFLERNKANKLWYEISEDDAIEKTRQALSEKDKTQVSGQASVNSKAIAKGHCIPRTIKVIRHDAHATITSDSADSKVEKLYPLHQLSEDEFGLKSIVQEENSRTAPDTDTDDLNTSFKFLCLDSGIGKWTLPKNSSYTKYGLIEDVNNFENNFDVKRSLTASTQDEVGSLKTTTEHKRFGAPTPEGFGSCTNSFKFLFLSGFGTFNRPLSRLPYRLDGSTPRVESGGASPNVAKETCGRDDFLKRETLTATDCSNRGGTKKGRFRILFVDSGNVTPDTSYNENPGIGTVRETLTASHNYFAENSTSPFDPSKIKSTFSILPLPNNKNSDNFDATDDPSDVSLDNTEVSNGSLISLMLDSLGTWNSPNNIALLEGLGADIETMSSKTLFTASDSTWSFPKVNNCSWRPCVVMLPAPSNNCSATTLGEYIQENFPTFNSCLCDMKAVRSDGTIKISESFLLDKTATTWARPRHPWFYHETFDEVESRSETELTGSLKNMLLESLRSWILSQNYLSRGKVCEDIEGMVHLLSQDPSIVFLHQKCNLALHPLFGTRGGSRLNDLCTTS